MAAYYDVVDPIGGLVSTVNPPYTKIFLGNANFMTDTMFLIWVKTNYAEIDRAALVRVNGGEIGKVLPRPGALDQPYINFEADSLLFPRTALLGGPYFGSPVYNTLEIVPGPDPVADGLLVDKVLFFRNTS